MVKFNFHSILKILLIGGIGVQTITCTSVDIPNLPSPDSLSFSEGSSSSGKGGSSSSGGKSSNSGTSSSSFSSSSVNPRDSESQEQGTFDDENNIFTDPRDGKEYKYETAEDGKIWMSENLNYSGGGTLGYCYGVTMTDIDFDDMNPHRDLASCDEGYGRAYTWEILMDGNTSQGLCPKGWHVPSQAEWETIIGNSKMSSEFYIITGNYNTNTLWPPLGWKERGTIGFYWTSTVEADGIYFILMNGPNVQINLPNATPNDDYFFVRCVAD